MLNKGYIFHYCTNVLGLTFVLLNFEYLSEKETKNQTILTHWSVAQAGSNDEKNWGLKISLDCPFNNKDQVLPIDIVRHPGNSFLNHPWGTSESSCVT